MAAAIYSTTHQIGVDINNVYIQDVNTPEYPAPPFIQGELAWGTDGSEWVYCTASITLASGSAVIISETPGNWSVALTTNTNGRAGFGQLVGVIGGSQGSMVVPAPAGTNKQSTFFWVQRAGNAPRVLCGLSVAANTLLHTGLGSGLLGASGGAGTSAQVAGIVFSVAANVSGTAYSAVLNYPTIGTAD